MILCILLTRACTTWCGASPSSPAATRNGDPVQRRHTCERPRCVPGAQPGSQRSHASTAALTFAAMGSSCGSVIAPPRRRRHGGQPRGPHLCTPSRGQARHASPTASAVPIGIDATQQHSPAQHRRKRPRNRKREHVRAQPGVSQREPKKRADEAPKQVAAERGHEQVSPRELARRPRSNSSDCDHNSQASKPRHSSTGIAAALNPMPGVDTGPPPAASEISDHAVSISANPAIATANTKPKT